MTEVVRYSVGKQKDRASAREESPTYSGQTSDKVDMSGALGDGARDHFVEENGLRFAGTHLILDLWKAGRLDDLTHMAQTLRNAAEACGATLLKMNLHSFPPTGGITGVAVLSESHISIHTWPERGYAALDIFMCGDATPHMAIEVIREAFSPESVTLIEHKRGVVP